MYSIRSFAMALATALGLAFGVGCAEKAPPIPPQDGKSYELPKEGKRGGAGKGAVEKFDTVPLPPKG